MHSASKTVSTYPLVEAKSNIETVLNTAVYSAVRFTTLFFFVVVFAGEQKRREEFFLERGENDPSEIFYFM